MRRREWRALVVSAGLVSGAASCTRANLDAIASGQATPGGSDDGGVVATCSIPALPAGDTNETVLVGATSRSYVLHVPATYDGTKPVPLVLDFHAQAGSGSRERALSPYPVQTDPDGAIMAFPDGLPGPAGAAWNVGPCCVANVDDVAFAKALVAQVQANACIDARRVYAVGTATGGGMANYLACRAADVFAAIAPAAFDLLAENADACKPPRPVTVISFRGTADTLVPYEGGLSSVVPNMSVTFLGAQATFQKWAEIDQCTDPASAADGNGCASHSSCQGGVEVVLCTKLNGGLEAGNAGVAWPVLKRHTL
jgi:polyhydroxybutyrate depolymerase